MATEEEFKKQTIIRSIDVDVNKLMMLSYDPLKNTIQSIIDALKDTRNTTSFLKDQIILLIEQ